MSRALIPDDVRAHVKARDNGCLAQRLGMAGPCAGWIEQDHILVGGMGVKGTGTQDHPDELEFNLASLCTYHHDAKTRMAAYWRPKLVALVAKLEARVREGFWPVEDSPGLWEAMQDGGFR